MLNFIENSLTRLSKWWLLRKARQREAFKLRELLPPTLFKEAWNTPVSGRFLNDWWPTQNIRIGDVEVDLIKRFNEIILALALREECTIDQWSHFMTTLLKWFPASNYELKNESHQLWRYFRWISESANNDIQTNDNYTIQRIVINNDIEKPRAIFSVFKNQKDCEYFLTEIFYDDLVEELVVDVVYGRLLIGYQLPKLGMSREDFISNWLENSRTKGVKPQDQVHIFTKSNAEKLFDYHENKRNIPIEFFKIDRTMKLKSVPINLLKLRPINFQKLFNDNKFSQFDIDQCYGELLESGLTLDDIVTKEFMSEYYDLFLKHISHLEDNYKFDFNGKLCHII